MLKTKILKKLNEINGSISGQQLCEEFEVSRTAIWKVIKNLKEDGYQIESVSGKGYHLIHTPNILTKSEIENHLNTEWIGREIHVFEKTQTTNNVAKELGDQGKKHGTLVVSDTQTDGKGRRGKSWQSPAGTSISMSVLLRPEISPEKASMLTLLMALSVVKGIEEVTETIFAIKWPNDIIFNKKKICGILTEMSAEPDMVHYIVIGVGINVNKKSIPKDLAPFASSLEAELGKEYSRVGILTSILFYFEKYYKIFLETEDLSNLKKEYETYLINQNQKVCVMEKDKKVVGDARGITDTGKLIIEQENNKVIEINAGEVSVRGIYGYV